MSHAPVLRTLAALLHYPGESLYDAIDALAAAIPTPVKKLLQDLQRNATSRIRVPR